MAEEMKSQEQAGGGQNVKGDFSTILLGVGNLLDTTLTPLGNALVQALESANNVAQQILEGISNSLNNKQGNQ
ncbi:MAG: hypothetical protein MI685_07460 [Chlorobiales bacterium]|nr:hypothetical protein [Chlorobiales bacterium]